MKISIIAGGRFHAFHLAHQLEKQHCLSKLYTFVYTQQDHKYLPTSQVNHFYLPGFINTAFQKSKLYKFITPSTFNSYKDNLFDYQVSRKITSDNANIFVCWANYALITMQKIKIHNPKAKIIIESGSCHILEQQKILADEYNRQGLTYPALHPKNISKMLKEYEQADYIMTLSNFSRSSFVRQGFSSDKLLKVTPGTDIRFFLQTQTGNITIPPKKFRAIFVGLAGVRKGVHYLVDAWNQLNLPENYTELLIVGNVQKDLKQVLSTKKLKSNIVFYGSTNRESLLSLYHSSNVFILPSLEEGCAMVTGEAMASGLPVICSTHSGADELMTNGKEGFLIPPYDVKSLKDKILWCYENQADATAMGQIGQQTIQKFTWDFYGQQVYDMYKKISS